MRFFSVLATLVLLGGGCVSLPFGNPPPDFDAEALDFSPGDRFELSQSIAVLGFDATAATKHVSVTGFVPGGYVSLSWSMDVKRETSASKTAREYAMTHAPVGEAANIPDPVYEDVTITGTVGTDALGNAERLLLPTYWPEGDYDVSRTGNSLLWLSRAQYDELVTTRSSHIQLGLFDSTLKDVIDFTEAARTALDRLQGKIAPEPTSNKDFTKLTAKGDWGTYDLSLNGSEVRVKTIEASNAFARYSILANPENPLILKVTVLPWALGPDMFTSLRELKDVLGYSVTSISLSSADQPQP